MIVLRIGAARKGILQPFGIPIKEIRTPENKLYLVSSNDWNLPQTENAYKWFLEKLTFLMDEEPADSETVAQILEGDDRKARILKELLLADLGISDVVIKNLTDKTLSISTTHRIIHEDGSTEYFQLLMDQESAGTQRFFSRIGGWLQALENGALLVVDEIEDSFHPLLTKRLIEMVQDRKINTNGAQILFTKIIRVLLYSSKTTTRSGASFRGSRISCIMLFPGCMGSASNRQPAISRIVG